MAVQLEFINLIVPVQRIKDLYPGGLDACLHDHAKSIGRIVWYDEFLFRTGAMAPNGIDLLIQKWGGLGFNATRVMDGKVVWCDLCSVNSFGFSRHQCEWIEVDGAKRIAWMRGVDPGEVVGRDSYRSNGTLQRFNTSEPSAY